MMGSRILSAIIIMVLFAVLAKLADFFIHRIFKYIAAKSQVEIDDIFVGIVHRPLWVIILLIGCLTAIKWVHINPHYSFILAAFLKSVLILIVGFTINKLMKNVCQRWCALSRQWVEIIHFSENLGRVFLVVAGAVLLMKFWKV